jgi:hypothetical protein
MTAFHRFKAKVDYPGTALHGKTVEVIEEIELDGVDYDTMYRVDVPGSKDRFVLPRRACRKLDKPA